MIPQHTHFSAPFQKTFLIGLFWFAALQKPESVFSQPPVSDVRSGFNKCDVSVKLLIVHTGLCKPDIKGHALIRTVSFFFLDVVLFSLPGRGILFCNLLVNKS
ncbi:hypothetical protein ILYODFUR_006346 [Ilyodon furcidens]|uniref:Uncharacterized protein n=1 Tax=Ilyodon furcidens TaxID=33524 RepID=A0ABV0U359_9TELE